MFKREHHQRLARVLGQLDAVKLRRLNCFFGGGTAIALRFGEWRESVDLDFLVSDLGCYRELRYQLTQANSLQPLQLADFPPFAEQREPLVDQYGIRFRLLVDQQPIKFEIVHEGRMVFEAPTQSDQVLGVATLNLVDLVASKLLANSDRWNDDGVFSRDLLDLAVLPSAVKNGAGLLIKLKALTDSAFVVICGARFNAFASSLDGLSAANRCWPFRQAKLSCASSCSVLSDDCRRPPRCEGQSLGAERNFRILRARRSLIRDAGTGWVIPVLG